jgi:glutamate synthase (NADPH/NADH) small chain
MAVKDRIQLPEQSAEVRKHNFDEVTTGYTLELAQEEAKRCLQCKVPTCI